MRSMRVLWGMLYVKVSISLRVSVAFGGCLQKADISTKLLVFTSCGMNNAGCAGVDAGALDTVFRAEMERRSHSAQLGTRDSIIMQAHSIQCADSGRCSAFCIWDEPYAALPRCLQLLRDALQIASWGTRL